MTDIGKSTGSSSVSVNSGFATSNSTTTNTGNTSQSNREKLLITGDDVLIEYVHRLMLAV